MPCSIEEARAFWAKVAEENDWTADPLYVQVWLDKDGNVADSVSYQGMTKELIIPYAGEDDDEDEE